ncbi:MAG: hypothetical protein U0Q22_07340 [Acidimicrobiales bacterium]
MEKLVYLLWGEAPAGSDRYRDLLVGELAPRLAALGATDLTISVDDSGSDCPSPVPTPDGEAPHVAAISFTLPCHDRRAPLEAAIESAATSAGLRAAGYLVSGAVYTDYGDNEYAGPRSWPAGERSPAVLTVCLIHRPAGADPATWVRQWHDVQSPVSAEIQPRMRYVRNEVIRALTPDAPPVDGIVEEAWPSAEHIVDPMLFFNGFGDRDRMNANISRMLDSVGSFIDMDRMRNVTMSEYLMT